MLETLARRWGVLHRWPEGPETAVLPTPSALVGATEADLREAGLGYRARYVAAAARAVADGAPLAALRGRPYPEALAGLLAFPGVGRKVADCVLLFSLNRPEAFPVDVWVRRALRESYARALARFDPRLASPRPSLAAWEYESLVRFARGRWGSDAGYAQQCLFHARRALTVGP